MSFRPQSDSETRGLRQVAGEHERREINFELKFCMKFYREVFQNESFSDSVLCLNAKINENLW